MSDNINLNYGREIRAWMEANEPPHQELKALTMDELIAMPENDSQNSSCSNAPNGDKSYFGVEHSIYTNDGEPLVTLGQVYLAKNAEEALQSYLFGYAVHQVGKGINCLRFKVRQYISYEMQDISVFKLAEGTESFL